MHPEKGWSLQPFLLALPSVALPLAVPEFICPFIINQSSSKTTDVSNLLSVLCYTISNILGTNIYRC